MADKNILYLCKYTIKLIKILFMNRIKSPSFSSKRIDRRLENVNKGVMPVGMYFNCRYLDIYLADFNNLLYFTLLYCTGT